MTTARPDHRLPPGSKALYRIPEAMQLLSMSRSVIYEQIRAGQRQRTASRGPDRAPSMLLVLSVVRFTTRRP